MANTRNRIVYVLVWQPSDMHRRISLRVYKKWVQKHRVVVHFSSELVLIFYRLSLWWGLKLIDALICQELLKVLVGTDKVLRAHVIVIIVWRYVEFTHLIVIKCAVLIDFENWAMLLKWHHFWLMIRIDNFLPTYNLFDVIIYQRFSTKAIIAHILVVVRWCAMSFIELSVRFTWDHALFS